ncbi:MAG: hypothetical protein ACMXYA_00580 [Candidatus Woesearchaeota archaeon]
MSVHLKKREIIMKNGRKRQSRPKTFKTQEAANAYAKEKGLKNYSLKNLRSESASSAKYRIVVNE